MFRRTLSVVHALANGLNSVQGPHPGSALGQSLCHSCLLLGILQGKQVSVNQSAIAADNKPAARHNWGSEAHQGGGTHIFKTAAEDWVTSGSRGTPNQIAGKESGLKLRGAGAGSWAGWAALALPRDEAVPRMHRDKGRSPVEHGGWAKTVGRNACCREGENRCAGDGGTCGGRQRPPGQPARAAPPEH